jgi:hypothetical protein
MLNHKDTFRKKEGIMTTHKDTLGSSGIVLAYKDTVGTSGTMLTPKTS